MNWETFWQDLCHNKVLICAGSSWALAQIIKTILYLIVNKRFRPERLIGSGGMPSCHSASVCALAVSTFITDGISSTTFALTMILAIVVMYDARGVRRETGRQAVVLNEMMTLFEKMGAGNLSNEDKLKEFVGHTPFQVLVGALIGISFSLLYCLVWTK